MSMKPKWDSDFMTDYVQTKEEQQSIWSMNFQTLTVSTPHMKVRNPSNTCACFSLCMVSPVRVSLEWLKLKYLPPVQLNF